MTTSHAANGNATGSTMPVLGWACALVLGLLMAGMLLCAALFISSRRNVEAAHKPQPEFTTARANTSRATEAAPPDSRSQVREYETAAGSAD